MIVRLIPKIIKCEINKPYLTITKLKPYLVEIGWVKSLEEQSSVDRADNPIPWFTYPMIKCLDKKIKSDMTVFEYGSGNSTFWLSQKVASIISYEHDFSWYNSIKEKLPGNVDYRYCEFERGGEYCKGVLKYNNEFDIVIIDGRDRVNCAKNVIGALKDCGVIIWDNSDREEYKEGYDFLENNGFRRLDFTGLGPINSYEWCSSLFFRDNNCFGV